MGVKAHMKYKKISAYKYEIKEDITVDLFGDFYTDFSHEYFELKSGKLTIKAGYCYDGCSGPTIDTKSNMLAGLVHDVLYQAIRKKLLHECYRKDADENLRYFMRKYHKFTENAQDLFAIIKELFKKDSDYSKKEIVKKITFISKELFLRFWTEFRACYFYYGVRWFGKSSIEPKTEDNEVVIEV